MTYTKRPGGPEWTKVVEVSGAWRLCSTGTRDKITADAVEAWHRQLRARNDTAGVLRAIVDNQISLAEAYSLDVAGTVAKLEQDATPAPIDLLAVHLPGFLKSLVKKNRAVKTRAQYTQQLRAIYPTGCTAGDLTPLGITVRLAAMDLDGPTQNRYRAALSGFCRYLVQHGAITTNPTRDVEAMPETKREFWHTRAQLAAALEHCDPETAFVVALAAGGGFEWCAIERVTPERIDLVKFEAHAEGGKTPWRNRHVRLYRWVKPLVSRFLAGKPRGARVVTTGRKWIAKRWTDACVAADVPVLRLHDNRHTHAVHLLQDGESYKAAAHQLGHKTEQLVISTYGMHAISQQHYRVLGTERGTTLTTKTRHPKASRPKTTKAASAASSTNLSPAAVTADSTHAPRQEISHAT